MGAKVGDSCPRQEQGAGAETGLTLTQAGGCLSPPASPEHPRPRNETTPSSLPARRGHELHHAPNQAQEYSQEHQNLQHPARQKSRGLNLNEKLPGV